MSVKSGNSFDILKKNMSELSISSERMNNKSTLMNSGSSEDKTKDYVQHTYSTNEKEFTNTKSNEFYKTDKRTSLVNVLKKIRLNKQVNDSSSISANVNSDTSSTPLCHETIDDEELDAMVYEAIVTNKESFYGEFVRNGGIRDLSTLMYEDDEEKGLNNEKSALFEFVQNFSRRISRTRESLTEKNSSVTSLSSEEDDDKYFQYDTSDSLKFFYNYDKGDNDVSSDETILHEDSLPENFFDDGNFQIEDGLIVLVEKKPIQKKLDFMSKVLPKCSSKCNEKKEFKPRAA